MLMIRDDNTRPSMFQDDEGFTWGKYIKGQRTEKWALVAEFNESREENHARAYLSEVYKKYMEAKWANRWDAKRECFVDHQGMMLDGCLQKRDSYR
ncbi:hypothetical protein Hanom_Chr00s006834g01736061 [Helianthus anomalus]